MASKFVVDQDPDTKRVYVGGLPINANSSQIILFLTNTLIKAGGRIDLGDPIVKFVFNSEKRYILLDIRSTEEAAAFL